MRWKSIGRPEKLLERSDPYFQWRLGAGAGGGEPIEWPVIVRLNHRFTALEFSEGAAWKSYVSVPEFYKRPVRELENARWCTALAKPQFFKILESSDELQDMISRIAVLPPIAAQIGSAEASLAEDAKQPFKYSGSGTVVIGIIDYGIAFAHERFRRAKDESRIEYLWVQDVYDERAASPGSGLNEARAEFAGRVAEASSQPEGQVGAKPVPYGREICAASINHLLSAAGATVDEDALYRQAAPQLGRRWLRSVSRRVAHGTHVMDLACGYDLTDRHREKRERRPIVCVQLPEATTADTSGENLDSYALDGIRYILDRADEIAQRAPGREHLPVVINFSYGNVAGPHDGTSDLEKAIDELIQKRRRVGPLEVIIPSGNSHLGRLHVQLDLKPHTPVELPWRVLPDDRTPSFLEIWLPRIGATDQGSTDGTGVKPQERSPINLRIRAPGSATNGFFGRGGSWR